MMRGREVGGDGLAALKSETGGAEKNVGGVLRGGRDGYAQIELRKRVRGGETKKLKQKKILEVRRNQG